jgi:poly-beta-hydroxyalkanoate depolymerase
MQKALKHRVFCDANTKKLQITAPYILPTISTYEQKTTLAYGEKKSERTRAIRKESTQAFRISTRRIEAKPQEVRSG